MIQDNLERKPLFVVWCGHEMILVMAHDGSRYAGFPTVNADTPEIRFATAPLSYSAK